MTAEPGVAAAPAAARIPAERTHHGDTVIDEYSWLAGKENPATIAFLEAENAYTQALTAGQAPLRDAIFGEIRARTQGDRPVGTHPQGRLVVLLPDGRGKAVRAALPAGRPARGEHAARDGEG